MAVRTLSSPPGSLSLYAKAALGAVPGSHLLPFVGGGGGEVPDLELELAGAEVDRDRLARYCRVCGFTLRDALPPTFPHILAFPLHMELMTDSSFPFGPIGLVHIANEITQRRPIDAAESLDVHVSASRLEPHPRGRQFSLLTRVSTDGSVAWESSSTILRRGSAGDGEGSSAGGSAGAGEGVEGGRGGSEGARGGSEGGAGSGGAAADPGELPVVAQWKLPGDLGRSYAGVSGDRNPIHLHDLTAKPLGFPRAIVHGMWTKARCLAALEGRLGDSYTVGVRFRKPIFLPARVDFAAEDRDDGIAFAVRDSAKGTPHLDGTIS